MNAKTLMLIGSIMIVISMFTPLATLDAGFISRSVNASDTDLLFAGIVGVVLFLISLGTKPAPGKRFSAFGGVLAIVALLITAWVWLNTSTVAMSTTAANVSTGMAIPLCGLGALLALFGGFTLDAALPAAGILEDQKVQSDSGENKS